MDKTTKSINADITSQNDSDDISIQAPKKKAHKKLVIISSIAVLILATLGFIASRVIKLQGLETNLRESYTLAEFNEARICAGTDNAIWEVNGYCAYTGRCPENLPLLLGENTIVVKEGSTSRTYNVILERGDTLGMPIERPDPGDLDYDGDGLTNREEVEIYGTSTCLYSTTGDGISDGSKVAMGLDPLEVYDHNTKKTLVFYMDGEESADVSLVVTGIGDLARVRVSKVDTTDAIDKGELFIVSDIVMVASSVQDNISSTTLKFHGDYDTSTHTIIEYDFIKKSLRTMTGTVNTGNGLEIETINFGNYYAVAKTSLIPDTLVSITELGPYIPDSIVGTEMTKAKLATRLVNTVGPYRVGFLVDVSANMQDQTWASSNMPSGFRLECNSNKPCNQDPEFHSLDIISSVHDRLRDSKHDLRFSLSGFTTNPDYCSVAHLDNQITTAHRDRIRRRDGNGCSNPNFFKGTDMYGAIDRMRTAIRQGTDDQITKHIIIFSDGHDNTSSFSSNTIRSIRNEGIKVSFVCMSPSRDCIIPTSLIDGTGGRLYYSADATRFAIGSADTNPYRLASWIINTFDAEANTDHIVVNNRVIPVTEDSGFRPNRHGFFFHNFGDQNSPGGNCFGFAYVSKGLFQDDLPTSMDSRGLKILFLTIREDLRGYNLSQRNINLMYRARGAVLYQDMHLGANAMSDDGRITQLVRNTNLQTDNRPRNITENDWQVLTLISTGQEAQNFSDMADFISPRREENSQNFIDRIEREVRRNNPAPLSMCSNNGCHAVLATKVAYDRRQDRYYFVLYDSNHPGVERYATLTFLELRSNIIFGTRSIYDFSYEDYNIVGHREYLYN
jgi:hypothetical protein